MLKIYYDRYVQDHDDMQDDDIEIETIVRRS